MYFVVVILLTILFPAGSAVYERFVQHADVPWMLLIGPWMVFWAGGVRLFLAGLRQTFQPRFTSEQIFGIKSDDPIPIVQELGFSNLAMGTLCLLSLPMRQMLVPAAVVSGLYYGLAGVKHVFGGEKNFRRLTAMVTDLLVAVVILAFLLATYFPAFAR
jgi:hypothetical protein